MPKCINLKQVWSAIKLWRNPQNAGILWWTSIPLNAGYPVLDFHPIQQGRVAILLVTECWVSGDELISHQGGVRGTVMLLVSSRDRNQIKLYPLYCEAPLCGRTFRIL